MAAALQLPRPVLDALPCGAHRLVMLTDDALFEACGVRIGFASREGGVSEGPCASLNTGGNTNDDMALVLRNRAIVCEAAGAPEAHLVVPRQVHGTNVVSVARRDDAPHAQKLADEGSDGVIVRAPGVAALLNAADCLTVVIVSPTGSFAVVHAGWRGALARIASQAVRELVSADEAEPSAYNAYLGPHIRGECFEVSVDIAASFSDEFGEGVLEAPRHVSLARAVSCDLQSAGLPDYRIADAGICTKCHPDRYFSYRATQGACGRHATIAVRP